MKSNKKTILIILAIIILLSMAKEFGSMARQTSFAEAILGVIIFTLIVIGVIAWIRKSRGGKDRIRKL